MVEQLSLAGTGACSAYFNDRRLDLPPGRDMLRWRRSHPLGMEILLSHGRACEDIKNIIENRDTEFIPRVRIVKIL